MPWDDEEDTSIYKVVANHEEQYSIWPIDRENPAGWKDAGPSGSKAECLAHIKQVWTDMRPLSLRRAMEEAARSRTAEAPEPEPEQEPEPPYGDELVARLATGRHPVAVSIRPDTTATALRERLELGYVHVKFTGTRGGTELGVTLDPASLDLSAADFAAARGHVHLEGTLTLNSVPVRCIADIDLGTLAGEGHLVVIAGAAARRRPEDWWA